MQGRKGWKAVGYFNPFPLLPRCGYTWVNSQPQYVALEHGTLTHLQEANKNTGLAFQGWGVGKRCLT